MAMHMVNPDDLRQLYNSKSADDYIEIFEQTGGALPFFQGSYVQKGHGFIGDLVWQIFVPLLKKAAPHLISGVRGVLEDVKKGDNVKESMKKHGLSTLKGTMLSGEGKVKRKRRQNVDYPLFR